MLSRGNPPPSKISASYWKSILIETIGGRINRPARLWAYIHLIAPTRPAWRRSVIGTTNQTLPGSDRMGCLNFTQKSHFGRAVPETLDAAALPALEIHPVCPFLPPHAPEDQCRALGGAPGSKAPQIETIAFLMTWIPSGESPAQSHVRSSAPILKFRLAPARAGSGLIL